MPNPLDLPPELNSLIEKREGDDRRQADSDDSTQNSGSSIDGKEKRSSEDRRENPSDDN